MNLTKFVIASFLSVLVFTGCGKAPNPFGAVYVEGTVTYDGTPIEGVSVTFIPQGGDLAAGGMTDSSGKFTLTIGGASLGSGAKPGQYDVTFTKVELPEMRPLGEGPVAMPVPTYLIPQKYENPRASGIAPVTVDSDKSKNKFTFALSSQ
jgi:hypothetical protein